MVMSNPLRLAEDRVLVEQLRLLMMGARNTVIPISAVIFFLVWSLSNANNILTLVAWAALALLSNLNFYRLSQHYLSTDIPANQVHRTVWVLMLLSAIAGALWGLLAWVGMDNSISQPSSLLVLVAIAAMGSGAASSRSAVLPIFIAFIIPEQLLTAAKMLQIDDPVHISLAAACIFYIFGLISQAHSNAKTIRISIELRFENLELMEQLRQETGLAKLARIEAEQANLAKSKFLAAASHDLRQPIHAQGLFLGLLSRTKLDMQQRELLDSVNAAGAASSEMFNTLLDFSRIDAGIIQPKITSFWIQAVLNKIEREFSQQADAKGLSYHSRESSLIVHSDPALIELVLRNLVSNAIRYTARGGLMVACRQRDNKAVLEVWDTGVGIAPEHQEVVFREFHQLGNPERDRQQGLGLGLSIVDGLVRTLDHPLSLKSVLGRGSVFKLTLPIADRVTQEPVITAEEYSHLSNSGIRILLIDDDEMIRIGTYQQIIKWGFACDAVEGMEGALTISQNQPPNLVISDYRLRNHNTGVEVITALRNQFNKMIPALLITGDTSRERIQEALSSGIPLLHKPLAPCELYRNIVKLLAIDEANSDQ
jgi:signal transduction histidine kinase/CheY-like chemotaxis protein